MNNNKEVKPQIIIENDNKSLIKNIKDVCKNPNLIDINFTPLEI
jgi:hypothetical protein